MSHEWFELCLCCIFEFSSFYKTYRVLQPESVREITDVLDAVGNTTKATTKGFAIGSAALASFLLFSAYMDEVSAFANVSFKEVHFLLFGVFCFLLFHSTRILILILVLTSKQVDIAIPEVFIGGLLGAMLIFLFSAWACAAVGRTAQEVVNEVRRQFIERPGIMVNVIPLESVPFYFYFFHRVSF